MKMSYAYNELYLPLAQRVLGDMYDYAVCTLHYTLKEFQKMFLVSLAKQFETGNPHYLAGKNGCEVAREVIYICTGEEVEAEDLMYVDKSAEYWIGWTLAYYQWYRGAAFCEMEEVLPVEEMYGMYPTMHEADVTAFVEILDERFAAKNESKLKRLRSYAQMSQGLLAKESEVSLRQIQLFEQGQRDINKTQGQTLKQLACVLKCDIGALLEMPEFKKTDVDSGESTEAEIVIKQS